MIAVPAEYPAGARGRLGATARPGRPLCEQQVIYHKPATRSPSRNRLKCPETGHCAGPQSRREIDDRLRNRHPCGSGATNPTLLQAYSLSMNFIENLQIILTIN